ncbi:conserved protein, unknown function [Hepatocystis sp. ex Piliocolobus tephrosceles]|nr:conserved protein, unknown function [Hepatocystis sp. ex Piliocolobus tephrosceles]
MMNENCYHDDIIVFFSEKNLEEILNLFKNVNEINKGIHKILTLNNKKELIFNSDNYCISTKNKNDEKKNNDKRLLILKEQEQKLKDTKNSTLEKTDIIVEKDETDTTIDNAINHKSGNTKDDKKIDKLGKKDKKEKTDDKKKDKKDDKKRDKKDDKKRSKKKKKGISISDINDNTEEETKEDTQNDTTEEKTENEINENKSGENTCATSLSTTCPNDFIPENKNDLKNRNKNSYFFDRKNINDKYDIISTEILNCLYKNQPNVKFTCKHKILAEMIIGAIIYGNKIKLNIFKLNLFLSIIIMTMHKIMNNLSKKKKKKKKLTIKYFVSLLNKNTQYNNQTNENDGLINCDTHEIDMLPENKEKNKHITEQNKKNKDNDKKEGESESDKNEDEGESDRDEIDSDRNESDKKKNDKKKSDKKKSSKKKSDKNKNDEKTIGEKIVDEKTVDNNVTKSSTIKKKKEKERNRNKTYDNDLKEQTSILKNTEKNLINKTTENKDNEQSGTNLNLSNYINHTNKIQNKKKTILFGYYEAKYIIKFMFENIFSIYNMLEYLFLFPANYFSLSFTNDCPHISPTESFFVTDELKQNTEQLDNNEFATNSYIQEALDVPLFVLDMFYNNIEDLKKKIEEVVT